jgi:hypothetical protein
MQPTAPLASTAAGSPCPYMTAKVQCSASAPESSIWCGTRLQVLRAAESGITNVVSVLTPISAQSLEQLASLMDEGKVEA